MSTYTPVRPAKPYAGFPLFAHHKGYWCKKIGGRQVTFGKWANPDPGGAAWKAALDRYHRRCEAIAKGLDPDKSGALSVADLVLRYSDELHRRVKAGKIGTTHLADCLKTARRFRDAVGPDLAVCELEGRPELILAWRDIIDTGNGWHSFNRTMAILSALFRWAEHPVEGVLGRPFRLRVLFKKRGAKELRKAKREQQARTGRKLFTPEQLRALIAHAAEPLRTFILLGYFGAFGNTDCAALTPAAVNLQPEALPRGWASIDFPRPKTGIDRAAALPPVVAMPLAAAIGAARGNRQDPAGPIFLDGRGLPFVREIVHRDAGGKVERTVPLNLIAERFALLRDGLGHCPTHGWIRGHGWCTDCGQGQELTPMPRHGFYALRHTAATYASGSSSDDAIHRWRGHALEGMSETYVEDIEAGPLKAIADRLLAKIGWTPDGGPTS
jgi:integrase